MTATPNHHAGKNLYPFLVAFNHFGVHTHTVAHAEIHGAFAKLFRLNFIK